MDAFQNFQHFSAGASSPFHTCNLTLHLSGHYPEELYCMCEHKCPNQLDRTVNIFNPASSLVRVHVSPSVNRADDCPERIHSEWVGVLMSCVCAAASCSFLLACRCIAITLESVLIGQKKLPVFLTDTLNHRLLGGSPNSVDSHYYGIAPEIKFGFPRIGQFVHVWGSSGRFITQKTFIKL